MGCGVVGDGHVRERLEFERLLIKIRP